MAAVKRLDGKGVFRFKDGSIIDDFLFENDPLPPSFHEGESMPDAEIDALINDLFPDIMLPNKQ